MNLGSAVLTLLFCAGLSLKAEAAQLKCIDEQDGQVSNKTKLLKTYTREYWQIASREIKNLQPELLKTGFVVGDFHFNNAGIYYDFIRNRAEFQINDFDDAGNNYLLVDFFKFVTYIQKLNKTIDPAILFNAYIAGLQKQAMNPPSELEAILYRSQVDFSKDSRKYIENQREEITAFDKNSLTKADQEKIARLQQLKVISRLSDLDYMVQINDSGSSMNALRIQFIGTDHNGVTGVVEFKQMKCSATGNPDSQDVTANFEKIKKFMTSFYTSNAITQQFTYRLDDRHYFLVREKRKNFLKKLSLESLPIARIAAFGAFYANYLGQMHAASADTRYIVSVKSHSEELALKAKAIAKKFKDEVKN